MVTKTNNDLIKIERQQPERKQRSSRLLMWLLRRGGADKTGSEEAYSRLPSGTVQYGNQWDQEVSIGLRLHDEQQVRDGDPYGSARSPGNDAYGEETVAGLATRQV